MSLQGSDAPPPAPHAFRRRMRHRASRTSVLARNFGPWISLQFQPTPDRCHAMTLRRSLRCWILEHVPHLEQFRQSSSAHVAVRLARNAPCVGFAQGLMADTVRQMSSAASQVALPRSVIMGRIRPLAAAPNNASGNDLRANRAESDLGIT